MGKKYIVELESGTHIFVLGPEGIVHIGEPDVVYETVDGMQIGNAVINAEPYTEPDLEQVKKKAYDEGYQSGREDWNIVMSDVEQAKADAYLKGLNDGQGVILASTQNNAFNNGYKKCLEDMEQVRKEAYQKGYETGYEDGYNEPGKNQQEAYQRGLSDAWEAARWIADTTYDVEQKIFGSCDWDVVKEFTASEAIEKIRQYEQEQENEFKVGDEFENEKSGKKFVVLKMNGKEIDRYIDVDGKTYCMTVKYKEMRKTGRHFPEIATVLEKMRGEQDG